MRRNSHDVKRYDHPIVGEMIIHHEALVDPDAADQTLYVYSTEPDTPSHDAIRLLAKWTTTNGR